jgi:hypothetical protein
MKSLLLSTISNFLLALFCLALFSCDDPYKVGLDLQRAEQLIGTSFKEDYLIETNVVLMDSISNADREYGIALRNIKAMLGYVSDPQFGSTRATIYSKIQWNGRKILDSVDTSNPDQSLALPFAYDSITLRLQTPFISSLDDANRRRLAYGDTTQELTIRVERLADALDTTKTYYTNQEHLPTTELLGRAKVKPVFRTGTTNGGRSTVYFYEFNIRLSDVFGRELYEKSGKPELASNAAFENMLKGIKVSVENTNSAAIWNLDLSTGFNSSGINLFYRYENSKKSTSSIYYLVKNPLTQAQWFTKVDTDFGNTPFLNKVRLNTPVSTKDLGNQLYIQDGTGLGVHLNFPTLHDLNNIKNSKDSVIMVNRAELYFEPLNNDAIIGFNQPPPSELFLYVGRNPTDLLIGKGGSGSFSYEFLFPVYRDAPTNNASELYFTYIPTAISYSNGFMTKYIQDVIDGKYIDKTGMKRGLFMVAGSTLSNSQTGQFEAKHDLLFNKVIIPDGSMSNGNKRLRLRVYYTKVKRS